MVARFKPRATGQATGRVIRKRVKLADGKSYEFVYRRTPPRTHVIKNGTRAEVQDFIVDLKDATLNDIRALSVTLATEVSNKQALLGNPPKVVLIDGMQTKSILRMMRTIDVYFGTDARPAMRKVRAIVTNAVRQHVPGISWSWLIRRGEGASYERVGNDRSPVILQAKHLLVLVPSGSLVDMITLYNIAFRLGIDVSTRPFKFTGVMQKTGFIARAGARANRAVPPLFYVRSGWSNIGKVNAGTRSQGRFNPVRKAFGLKTVKPYVQGRPVFLMSITYGGRVSTIGRRS